MHIKENVEKVWRTLTAPERAALIVLMDVLTNRSNVVKGGSVAINSVAMMNDRRIGQMDSTMLRQEAQDYLEKFLDGKVFEHFSDLYEELFKQI